MVVQFMGERAEIVSELFQFLDARRHPHIPLGRVRRLILVVARPGELSEFAGVGVYHLCPYGVYVLVPLVLQLAPSLDQVENRLLIGTRNPRFHAVRQEVQMNF